jgi:hypothetical protein
MHEGRALSLFSQSQHKHWVLYEGVNAEDGKRVAIAPDDSDGNTLQRTLELIGDGQYTLISVSKKGASGNECRIVFTKGTPKIAMDSAQQSFSAELLKAQFDLNHKNAKTKEPKTDALSRIAGLLEAPLARAIEKYTPIEAIAGVGMSEEEKRFSDAITAIDELFPDYKPIAVIEKVISALKSPETGDDLKKFIMQILNG